MGGGDLEKPRQRNEEMKQDECHVDSERALTQKLVTSLGEPQDTVSLK